MHELNCFITLTYEKIPARGSLDVSHWQDFAKRLRRSMGKFRFFHCGEYGEKYGRPHLHSAIFGLDFHHDRTLVKHTKAGHPLYTSKTLETAWSHGLVYIGELTFESAAYVARYIMKKQTGEKAYERYGLEVDTSTGEVQHTIKPEYTTMSRRPGIGKSWIDKYINEVYPADEVITRGHPSQPPKFYDRQLEKADPEAYRRIKINRGIEGTKHTADNTYDRLEVRETVAEAEMREFIREIEQ